VIRRAVGEDAAVLRDVEVASGQLFRDVGMAEIADDEPMWLDSWPSYVERTWVYEVDGAAVGFVMCEELGDALHIEQLSVDPAHGRRGIGAALVRHAITVAARRPVTLTTFRHVPWNMPFYERLGFVEAVDPSPALLTRFDEEAALGLDPTTRVMMIRP
jgi:ribosomal protein S18 acetylase RimI-like enzyme